MGTVGVHCVVGVAGEGEGMSRELKIALVCGLGFFAGFMFRSVFYVTPPDPPEVRRANQQAAAEALCAFMREVSK